MGSYKLADFLSQEIPDHLMLDIALHFQANDNRYASKHSRRWDTPFNPPSRQADNATSGQGHNAGDPHSLPRGVEISDISERLGSLWSWCRTAVTRRLEAFLSLMAETFLAGILDRQPG
jgi:hypothetical protein